MYFYFQIHDFSSAAPMEEKNDLEVKNLHFLFDELISNIPLVLYELL